ncbi:hypothetical protein LF1_46770 [Rubripirellula obstinata]|uniref:DUF4139 domain-containing protein n=1 Tax=Rubripirellula obstinata TaxID=406547 RepID=A0A5B1CNK3_9BACT|nr:DUF4139 domain-containing protein [Rubripirellula obstinata]KAA1262116.1 hypothetical protein LF1_46770 [Rubripirellula obstinata]
MIDKRTYSLLLISLIVCISHPSKVYADNATDSPPKTGQLKLQEVWLHSTGKGYFVYQATVQQETEFTIPVRSDEVSDIVRHAIVLDPESKGRVTMPSKPDPQTPRTTLPSTSTLADLLLSMRGQTVSAVDQLDETIQGRLVALELRTEFVDKQKVEYEHITIATDAGLRSLPLSSIHHIATDDQAFNDRLNMALDRLIADDSVETTEVSIRFDAGKQRKVQVHLLREMPIWKVSYLTTVDEFLLRATVDNTTSEDWNDVRVILKTGRPMNFDMDVASIVRANRQTIARPLPSLRVAPTLAESNAWAMDSDASAEDLDIMNMTFGGESDPFGGSGGDPFSDKVGGGGGGLGGGGMGGMMGGSGKPRRSSTNTKTNLNLLGSSKAGNSTDQAAGAALVVTFDKVDLPAGKMILLDTPIGKVNGEIVSVYRAKDNDSQPMLSLKIRPDVAYVLPAGPLTVYAGDTNYGGEAIMPAITPGIDRLIPFATDQAVRVRRLPIQRSSVNKNVELFANKHQMKYETLTTATISYRINNRDVDPKTILLEHPRPTEPTEVVLGDDSDTEPTEDAIRFKETVPASATVQRDVVEQRLVKHIRQFSDISAVQLEELIGDDSIDQDIRDSLKEILQQQTDRTDLTAQIKQAVANKEQATKEIQRITQLLRPTVGQGNGLSAELLKRYESRLIELETKRDGVMQSQAELIDSLKAVEQALGINRTPSGKTKIQRQQNTMQGGMF